MHRFKPLWVNGRGPVWGEGPHGDCTVQRRHGEVPVLRGREGNHILHFMGKCLNNSVIGDDTQKGSSIAG